MGMLGDDRGCDHPLASRTLVGRGPLATLRLPSRMVSSEHATIVWTDGAWILRDLGSRNGTYVDGRRLGSTDAVVLCPGMRLAFGAPVGGLRVLEVERPLPFATAGDVRIRGQDGLLLIPEDAPEVAIFEEDDHWVAESPDGTTPVDHGQTVLVDGTTWTLSLPVRVDRTRELGSGERTLEGATLVFAVSRDEEYVHLSLDAGGERIDLDARAHHPLLLELARRRLADSDLPPGERGWAYSDELARSLGLDERALNLHVHRARKQLASARVQRAAQLVERRPTTKQIRLGTDAVRIGDVEVA